MTDLDTSVNEAHFSAWLRDLRDKTDPRWRMAHFRPARTGADGEQWRTPVGYDGAGFPDLVLVHPQRRLVLFRELKAGRGVISDRQADWINDLRAAGADAGVWHPKQWREILDVISDGRAVA